jgi:hypothetical protein
LCWHSWSIIYETIWRVDVRAGSISHIYSDHPCDGGWRDDGGGAEYLERKLERRDRLMTDEQKYERELGGINEKLAYLLKGQDDIFQRLNALTAHGCARGEQNAKDIAELRNQPSKVISMGAAIIAAVSAVLAWVHRS